MLSRTNFLGGRKLSTNLGFKYTFSCLYTHETKLFSFQSDIWLYIEFYLQKERFGTTWEHFFSTIVHFDIIAKKWGCLLNGVGGGRGLILNRHITCHYFCLASVFSFFIPHNSCKNKFTKPKNNIIIIQKQYTINIG